MTNTVTPPDVCQSMQEVRAGVDAIDRAIIDLLVDRFAYMRAAARIKTRREHVRDEARKHEVIEAAKADALARGVPVGLVADFWERLVETSISYELEAWDRARENRG